MTTVWTENALCVGMETQDGVPRRNTVDEKEHKPVWLSSSRRVQTQTSLCRQAIVTWRSRSERPWAASGGRWAVEWRALLGWKTRRVAIFWIRISLCMLGNPLQGHCSGQGERKPWPVPKVGWRTESGRAWFFICCIVQSGTTGTQTQHGLRRIADINHHAQVSPNLGWGERWKGDFSVDILIVTSLVLCDSQPLI